MIPRATVRRLAVPAAVLSALLIVYGFTLARDVTFWDAGEFIAAASVLGIPHPPGTPLYVLVLRAVVVLLGGVGVPAAVATSLVSAACTAGACAAGASLLFRTTRDGVAAVAAGITAGTMGTVWLNATETEVYAASLALSIAIIWAAERAGRQRSLGWSVAAMYLVTLALPVHLSALLAVPSALVLAIDVAGGADRHAWVRGGIILAAAVAAFAIARMSVAAGAAATALLVVACAGAAQWPVPSDDARASSTRVAAVRVARALLPAFAVAIGASAILVLLVRARHDPAVNQGNPATLAALADLVARRQYDVAALWPRQAPLWLQLGNLVLYADWQVALSLGPTIFPTPLRTTTTVVFVLIGAYGAFAHRRLDRRSWRAFAALFLAGTVGAALYLNLKAGPSFGHGLIPDGSAREARERDYFFVLGWWAWGMWAGFGAVMLVRRLSLPVTAGVALALVPAVLNWQVVDRTRLPEAVLPRATAEAMLLPLPRRAVLFVAGDNDTYPLWYAQHARGIRRDVTVVTIPLLPADWYRAELARRDSLLVPDAAGRFGWRGSAAAMQEIAARARVLGRPVATSVAVRAAAREAMGNGWTLRAATYVENGSSSNSVIVDTTAAALWAARLSDFTQGHPAHPAIDGTARYTETLLRCPGIALDAVRAGTFAARADSLARSCNFR